VLQGSDAMRNKVGTQSALSIRMGGVIEQNAYDIPDLCLLTQVLCFADPDRGTVDYVPSRFRLDDAIDTEVLRFRC
jgi:hypothetical protein